MKKSLSLFLVVCLAAAVLVFPTPVKALTYGLSLSANPAGIVQGGSTTITAAVLLDNVAAPAGEQVNWSIVAGPGGGRLGAVSSSTDDFGYARVTFIGDQAGQVTIQASLASEPSIEKQIVINIAPPPVYGLTLTASPASVAVGGKITLSATLKDNGNAISGERVNWTITSGPGGGTLDVSNSLTNSSGQATAVFTASQAGALTIKATLHSDSNINMQTAITVTPAQPVYSLTLYANPTTIGNKGYTTLLATLTNNGVAVSGQQINWSIYSGTGSGNFSASKSTTNNYGQATVVFTASNAGGVTLKAALNSDSAVTALTSITVQPSYTLTLSASPASIVNGGYSTLTAILKDNGVAVSGQRINWSVISGYSGGGSLGASYSTTDANGKATVRFTASRVGTAGIKATLSSNANVYNQTSVAISVPTTKITLNKTALTLSIGGGDTLTATIAPTNASNKGVTWASNNTKVATVNSSGRVTGVNAGTATITATAADGSGIRANCAVTVIPTTQPTPQPGVFPAVSVVNVKNAAVRPNANTKGKILGRLQKGASVRVIGITNGYFAIPWPNAAGKAYVSASQLNVTLNPPLYGTAKKSLSIYSRTSALKKYRLAIVPKGTALWLTGRYGSWYKMDLNGQAAYVKAGDISVKNQ